MRKRISASGVVNIAILFGERVRASANTILAGCGNRALRRELVHGPPARYHLVPAGELAVGYKNEGFSWFVQDGR